MEILDLTAHILDDDRPVPVMLIEAVPLLDEALDSLPDGFYLFDSYRRLARINPAGAQLEFSQSGPLEGNRCCDMFWRVPEATECVVDRAIRNGETVEVEILAGMQGDRPTLLTVIPLRETERAPAGSAVVIAHDVTELRQAEAEALEQKSIMASLADLAPDEIYTLDLSGRFTWMNERAVVSNDVIPSGMMGRQLIEIVAAESRERVNDNLARTFAGESTRCEVQVIRADATVRYVEAHTSPLWKEGNVNGALVFLRDQTERKRAEERMAQSDKLRAVGELAAGVAHNLNNALTVIQGRAQLLMMRTEDEATRKSLEVITRAVGDGSQTLRRILDFARRDRAQDFAPVDLAELITSSVEIARPKWQSRSATRSGSIDVTTKNQGTVYVLGESAELREVVLNMIFNAVDAMPDGGIIETGTRAELDGACFWVADNGCGISPETVARIFEPFYTTKGERGTGLGLAASHGIIERHGGRIMVVSEPGMGTRFEVRLPIYEKSRTSFTREEITVMPMVGEPARVLVVEDEDGVRAILRDTFETAGHIVTEASTGSQAISRLEEARDEKFDIVISDLGLPEVSGLHVARWVKEHSPNTFFILVTGWPDMVASDDYEKARLDLVMKKPFSGSDVLLEANKLLSTLEPIETASQD
jgi:PAS domain S-box-containing protein